MFCKINLSLLLLISLILVISVFDLFPPVHSLCTRVSPFYQYILLLIKKKEWDRLKQGTSSVMDYIEQFKEYKRCCQIVEEEVVTLNRFKKGLNPDLMKELIIRGVTSLDHAYELARNYELVTKSLFVQLFEPCRAYSNPHSSNSKGLAVPPNSSIVSTNANYS